jgi:nucleoside-diphosphate-sugar epimerase
MRALFIGGTGTISTAISQTVLDRGWDLYLLNRGSRQGLFGGRAVQIPCDINTDADVEDKLKGLSFDVVADFIGFTPDQIERDIRLFAGKTKQYLWLSSASAYQKPLSHYMVDESTPLANPFWEYSRNKIACEEVLMKAYRDQGFPATIVRPSHTYDDRSIPLGVHGKNGSWQVVKRIMEGKPVIIHGDGTSLWTMTHCSDFARGFVGLMGNTRAVGEAVQITSDETLTWNQVYEAIARAVGEPLKAVHISSAFLSACGPYNFFGGLIGDKANSVVFDNRKLKRLVPDFVAHVRFEQGVQQALAYITVHPELQKDDPEFDAWCDRVIAVRGKALAELAAASH